jgi:hypothetical protein
MTWPLCALVLGLAFVLALWDGLRRYADARGVKALVEKRIEASDEMLSDRLKTHQIALDKIETATNAYVAQTTSEIKAIAQAQGFRATRTS